MVKRRTSFRTMIGCVVATIVGRCVALGEVTKFYWPGHWSEKALRRHLLTDDQHLFDPEEIKGLSFQDCIDLHDWHHWEIGHKKRTPFPQGKQLPGTKRGRGTTTKPAREDWEGFLERGAEEPIPFEGESVTKKEPRTEEPTVPRQSVPRKEEGQVDLRSLRKQLQRNRDSAS